MCEGQSSQRRGLGDGAGSQHCRPHDDGVARATAHVATPHGAGGQKSASGVAGCTIPGGYHWSSVNEIVF